MTRLFSPKHYPVDELDKRTLTEQWLNWLVTHFHWSNDLINQCNVELLEFVDMLSFVCEHHGMHEAWIICGNDREFMINWPTLILLWQTILMIPTSIGIIANPNYDMDVYMATHFEVRLGTCVESWVEQKAQANSQPKSWEYFCVISCS